MDKALLKKKYFNQNILSLYEHNEGQDQIRIQIIISVSKQILLIHTEAIPVSIRTLFFFSINCKIIKLTCMHHIFYLKK